MPRIRLAVRIALDSGFNELHFSRLGVCVEKRFFLYMYLYEITKRLP